MPHREIAYISAIDTDPHTVKDSLRVITRLLIRRRHKQAIVILFQANKYYAGVPQEYKIYI